MCEWVAMRDERAADVDGGGIALCAGAEELDAALLAFIARQSCSTVGVMLVLRGRNLSSSQTTPEVCSHD